VFENLNNEAKDAYEFELPMPFPKGVAVNWAFGVDMKALDYDIGNENIDFTIEGPNENFEVVSNGASADPWVSTIIRLNNSMTIRIGASHHFLRTRINAQNSARIESFPMVSLHFFSHAHISSYLLLLILLLAFDFQKQKAKSE